MKKIGFVIPWFGMNIPGGAEAALRGLTKHLAESGMELEILSTCVKEFLADWNDNYHKPGLTVEGGITIRRFPVRKRDAEAFHKVNIKLMRNQMPLTEAEEKIFAEEMINSPDLYDYIGEHKEEYGLFVFTPYMFGTTYYGIQRCLEKAVLIPCFHNESYVYMEIFKKIFPKVAGMIFYAQPEAELAKRVYDLSKVNMAVLGGGVYTDITYDSGRFRKKYHIDEPFILYAGRKDVGKNIYTLIHNFAEYKARNHNDLKLVLIGGGTVTLPEAIEKEVYDLGFVDLQDKFDAYAAAHLLCQPSKNESFSLVIMESWLCGRPALVHEECAVTSHFARQSGAGLYFGNYFEFEGAVNYLLKNDGTAAEMGKLGREFVMSHFAWDVIVEKYTAYFEALCNK
mgnify:CR=1 FL=1